MRHLTFFLFVTAICLALVFSTGCDKQKMFNDTLVEEDDEIAHQLELLFGKQQTFKLDQTPMQRLETLKKKVAKAIETAEDLDSDGSDEAEDLRDAFLDLFDYYDSSTDGILMQIVELMSPPFGDETSDSHRTIKELSSEFYQGAGNLYDVVEEAQKVYAKKIGAELVKHRRPY